MIVAKKANQELGWFLMRWQGHLRHLAQKHRVIVECEDWQRYLVEDFAYTGEPEGEITEVHRTKRLWKKKHLPQKFIQYGTEGKPGFDIVIHARDIDKGVHQNWGRWEELLKELDGYSIAFVGTPAGAKDFIYGIDQRGLPLEKLCDMMRNSKLMIAESSGPVHLAALCGLTNLTITDRKRWNFGGKKGRNWTRLKHYWNPLSTPAYILDQDNYDPPVEKVLRAISKNNLL